MRDFTATDRLVGSVGAPTASEYTSRLGEAVPREVSRFAVALALKNAATAVGDAVGFAASARAATPATWGDAIEVPLMVLVAVELLFQAEVMLLPGAKISTQDP